MGCISSASVGGLRLHSSTGSSTPAHNTVTDGSLIASCVSTFVLSLRQEQITWERAGRVKGANSGERSERTLDAPKRFRRMNRRSDSWISLKRAADAVLLVGNVAS
jgi:hypothetical protein